MPDQLPLESYYTDEIFRAVGLLFLTSALVEQVLGFHMARLIAHPGKLDAATPVALQGTETKVRLQQIQILARFRLAEQHVPEVIRLCDKLRDAFDIRNHFAHYANVRGSSPDRIVLYPARLRANGSLVLEKPFHAEQIREAASRIHQLAADLDAALTRAGVAPLGPVAVSPPKALQEKTAGSTEDVQDP